MHGRSLNEQQIEDRVEGLMARLTLTDKVGQMTQFAIDVLMEGEPRRLRKPNTLNAGKLEHVISTLRAGSILNVGEYAYTREFWNEIHQSIQQIALATNGIPVLYGIDAIHGTNYTIGATLFPQQIGLAATWNTDLAEHCAAMCAYETRASGIPWTFSPVLDIGRDPRWPRIWEGFGEDVLLAAHMGQALVRGYQGQDVAHPHHIAACLKHFMGYSTPLTGKDRTQAWIPERQLREYVMPVFQAAIVSGAQTVMINSGDINGIPVHSSEYLLTDLLREEMGFKGVAVTDWEDVGYLVHRHRVASDYKDAIRMAVNAGIDMAMVPFDTAFPVLLKELVEEGKVPMSRIDESVRRVLTLKVRVGLFEMPITHYSDYPDFASDKHIQLAYDAAGESITLLKNAKDILPLASGTSVAVVGPTAHNLNYLNGGWTWTWQGDQAQYHPDDKQTILDAINSAGHFRQVVYAPGSDIDQPADMAEAVEAAQGADVAIICLGESTYTEFVGNISDLRLPQAQIDLVKAIATTGIPIVLVLVEGRPRIIHEVVGMADAVIMAYLPGNEGGRAISDVITGKINPSGKLPFTYPSSVNSLIPYDHRGTDQIDINSGTEGFQPEFEFGHGLSYTNFEYSDIRVSSEQIEMQSDFTVNVQVRNTGSRAGKEVVQLYITDLVASVAPSVKRLRGFKKINLEAGAMQQVSFQLNTSDLAFVGRDNHWVTEPGIFEIRIEDLHKQILIK